MLKNFFKLWVPVFLYMGFMWHLSAQPVPLPPFLQLLLAGAMSPFAEFLKGGFVSLDKITHLFEYIFFGYLLTRALFFYSESELKLAITVLVIGLIWGSIDEIHQIFVPMRTANVLDLMADFIGTGLGVVLKIYRNRVEEHKYTDVVDVEEEITKADLKPVTDVIEDKPSEDKPEDKPPEPFFKWS